MRYHAIPINFENQSLIAAIRPDFPQEDYAHFWFLVPEDGSRTWVCNDLTMRSRFDGFKRRKNIQIVSD